MGVVLHIRFSMKPKRKRPKEGDRKVVGDVRMVRRQVFSKRDLAYVVNNGKPVFEWVRESE